MTSPTLRTDTHHQAVLPTAARQRIGEPPPQRRDEHCSIEAESDFRLRLQHHTNSVVVVHVAGALDQVTTAHLALLLQPRVDSAADTVIVDLSRVDFVGTAALQLLVHARQRTRLRGMNLRLVAGPVCLRRALRAAERVGAGSFETYSDLATALGHDRTRAGSLR